MAPGAEQNCATHELSSPVSERPCMIAYCPPPPEEQVSAFWGVHPSCPGGFNSKNPLPRAWNSWSQHKTCYASTRQERGSRGGGGAPTAALRDEVIGGGQGALGCFQARNALCAVSYVLL